MKRKLTALIISLIICIGLNGCGGSGDSTREISTSDKEFLMLAYATPYNLGAGDAPYGLQPELNTEENWRILAEAGFNYALPVLDISHEHILKTLENAQSAGVKVLIMDADPSGLPAIVRRGEGKSYGEVMAMIEQSEDIIIERYNLYKTYSSFAGVSIFDEPAASFYSAIAAGQDWWLRHFPEYEYYCNLLPSYASYGQLFGSDSSGGYLFPDYVDQYVQTTNPAFISYDHYCLLRSGLSGTIRPSWLYDLEVFAEASKEYEIPFYIFLQCTRHWNYVGPETYREFAWQAYSSMAYGTKGLQTFRYWSYMIPNNNPDNLGEGLVGPTGEIMPLYYAVQEVFNEIKSFQDLYMAFDWEGTMPVGVSGGGAYALLRNPLKSVYGVSKVEAEGDALIGQFKDGKGNTAYMVTNYNSPFKNQSNKITMTFEKAQRVLICKKGRKIVQELDNKTLTLEMGAGEGFFVIPIK